MLLLVLLLTLGLEYPRVFMESPCEHPDTMHIVMMPAREDAVALAKDLPFWVHWFGFHGGITVLNPREEATRTSIEWCGP